MEGWIYFPSAGVDTLVRADGNGCLSNIWYFQSPIDYHPSSLDLGERHHSASIRQSSSWTTQVLYLITAWHNHLLFKILLTSLWCLFQYTLELCICSFNSIPNCLMNMWGIKWFTYTKKHQTNICQNGWTVLWCVFRSTWHRQLFPNWMVYWDNSIDKSRMGKLFSMPEVSPKWIAK